MKEIFKREEVHQLIYEAVKNANKILISEFVNDLNDLPINASYLETYDDRIQELTEKWEEKLK